VDDKREISLSANAGPTIFVPYIHAFGGVERLILGLSRHLHEAGLPHAVACFEDTIDYSSRADWPVQVIQLKPRRNPASEARALHRLLKVSKKGSTFSPLLFDLKSAFYAGLSGDNEFFLHFTDPPSLLGDEITKHAYSLRKNIHATSARQRVSPMLALRAELAHRLTRKGVRAARSVIVMTENISKEIAGLYGVSPVIMRPGVKGLNARPKARQSPLDEIRVLSVARLEAGKNLAWIIRAMSNTDARWTAEFAGTGPYESELRELAEKTGVAERVTFHGFVTDEQLESLYARSHVVAVPAVQGYGLPALEALARGVPVALNRASGVSEILGGSQWVEISNDNEQDFAKALRRMVDLVQAGSIGSEPLPSVPTESTWAESVCRHCGWL
jgi:glycosyltransferase involved in cell wall biosynthesis